MTERKMRSAEEIAKEISRAEAIAISRIDNGNHRLLVEHIADFGSHSRELLFLMKRWAEEEQTDSLRVSLEEAAKTISLKRESIKSKLEARAYSEVKLEIENLLNRMLKFLLRVRESINEQLRAISTNPNPQVTLNIGRHTQPLNSRDAKVKPVTIPRGNGQDYPYSTGLRTTMPEGGYIDPSFTGEEIAELEALISTDPNFPLQERHITASHQSTGEMKATDSHQTVTEQTQPSEPFATRKIRRNAGAGWYQIVSTSASTDRKSKG